MREAGSILPPPQPQLSPREFEEISELAHRAFGLALKPGKEEMVSARLSRLVIAGGHASFHEYAQHVAADSTGKSMAALVDALATNHTSFLREPDHFDFFRERIAPELGRRPAPEVWCAACSTGEEAWTLACTWNEVAPNSRLRIHASDISNRALRRARAGEYSRETCTALPPVWMARFFEPIVPKHGSEIHYRVGPLLRSQVEFRHINLMEPLPWLRPFPAIFCRNVMIYFDRETQQGVVHRITECLEPGGYLFTGHAEGLSGMSHALEYVQPAIYRKPVKRVLSRASTAPPPRGVSHER